MHQGYIPLRGKVLRGGRRDRFVRCVAVSEYCGLARVYAGGGPVPEPGIGVAAAGALRRGGRDRVDVDRLSGLESLEHEVEALVLTVQVGVLEGELREPLLSTPHACQRARSLGGLRALSMCAIVGEV